MSGCFESSLDSAETPPAGETVAPGRRIRCRMQRFQSEGFDFDLNRGRIVQAGGASGDGRETELRPQLLTILRLLVENAGRVVARDEIQSEVWGDTVVDADNGLNFCIRQLRLLLDDDAKNPRFIETVPRRGYVWIAPLAAVHAAEGAGAVDNDAPRDSWRPGLRLALVAMALGVTGFAVADWTDGLRNPASTVQTEPMQSQSEHDEKVDAAFLEARRLRLQGWEERLDDAQERLDFVLAHRPGWVPAAADLAVVRLRKAEARPADMIDIETALLRGLDHEDPRVALEARLRLAQVEMASHWNWTAAREHLERAMALDPAHSPTHRRLALLETALGHHERAVQVADRAIELEPVESLTRGNQFLVHHVTRNHERALELTRRTLDIDPANYSALFVHLSAAEQLGRWQTAASTAPEILAIEGLGPKLPEDPREAVATFHRRRLDMRRARPAETSWELIDLALGHAYHGEADAAFAALDRVLAQRSMHLALHLSNSRFDPIRSDPRWAEAMRRMGLEERLLTDAALVAAYSEAKPKATYDADLWMENRATQSSPMKSQASARTSSETTG